MSGKPTTLSGYGITDAQPLDADLTSIAALATTAFGRGALTQTDAAAFRGYIGAGSGGGDLSSNTSTSVDSELALFNGTSGKSIKRGTGSGIATLASGVLGTTPDNHANWDTAFTERERWNGGATNLIPATGRTSLGLVIGTHVQAWDSDLDAIAAISGARGDILVFGASGWTKLAAGSAGNQLTTHGAGADPTWDLPGGGGGGGGGAPIVYLQTVAVNPAGTTALGGVMAGLAGVLTPVGTGKVFVTVTGRLTNNTTNDGVFAQMQYGTGGAPANGAANTGTQVGSNVARTGTGYTGTMVSAFSLSGVISGLTRARPSGLMSRLVRLLVAQPRCRTSRSQLSRFQPACWMTQHTALRGMA